jgi:hypothetical protein
MDEEEKKETEPAEVEDKVQDGICNKNSNKSAMVLFSGGFDSTAVLSKLIDNKEYNTLYVVYENIKQSADGYHDFSYDKAMAIYNLLQKKAAKKEIKLVLRVIDMDANVTCDWGNGCDSLLMLHLTTILDYSGSSDDIYLSWNKQHIDALKELKAVDCSLKMLDMMQNVLLQGRIIHYLEDSFPGYDSEVGRKAAVLEYLLCHNMFGLCFSYDTLTTDRNNNKNRKSYQDKQKWFFEDDIKSRETASALVETGLFNSEELSELFNLHTTQDIQNFYNTRENKKTEQEKQDRRYNKCMKRLMKKNPEKKE